MKSRVLLGVVDFCPFVRSYPLGLDLLRRVQAPPWDKDQVLLRELNWGPIAIVQDFQAKPLNLTRAVLIAATDRGDPANTVSCRRWQGGALEPLVVQQRVFQAVTGTISLDNLLVIGEHFGIWPPEVLTVEVQLAQSNVGAFVMAELEAARLPLSGIVGEQPLSAEFDVVVDRIAELARRAVTKGAAGLPELRPLTASQLTPIGPFCHTIDVNEGMDQSQPGAVRH